MQYGNRRTGGREYGADWHDSRGYGADRHSSTQREYERRMPQNQGGMGTSESLRTALLAIDHRGYPAYKSLTGQYRFPKFILSIDHVQGDPFASPSHLTVFVSHKDAGFSASLYETKERSIALSDLLLRRFGRAAAAFQFQAKGSGKSGLISVTRCGQEILERTDCEITKAGIRLCLHVGFPANGRSINAGELEKILFRYLPSCVEKALLAGSYAAEELEGRAALADDQQAVRLQLKEQGLIAFVADGSLLPRESGVSDLPMKQAVRFCSPETLCVSLKLPHRGTIKGMGIRKGVTLIAGGGYHGKSTLLKALEKGVYNHIEGDGREFVITDAAAMKLRAEDGRYVRDTDISLFINDLPNRRDTKHFSTEDASGSTSQAAGIVEGIAAGCSAFLIDEDTSAANFMVRDRLMQAVISREKEPITPFVERVRDLYEKIGISTILVAGSSGAFFKAADTVLQMDCYETYDITGHVKDMLQHEEEAESREARAFVTPECGRPYAERDMRLREAKVKVFGLDSFALDRCEVDLRALEQLADSGQTAALAQLLRLLCADYADGKKSLAELVREIERALSQDGISALMKQAVRRGYVPAGFTRPRPQELYACAVRYRRA